MKSPETSSNFLHSLFRRLAGRLRITEPKWDWRGWIALVWVIWWGWLYSLMVIETKCPQVLIWLRRAMAVCGGQH
jgi:hypothetical protein